MFCLGASWSCCSLSSSLRSGSGRLHASDPSLRGVVCPRDLGWSRGALSQVADRASPNVQRRPTSAWHGSRTRRTRDHVDLVEETPAAFLDRSRVSADLDADLLRFNVQDADPRRAPRVATAYAREFTRYRNALDVQSLRSTRATIARSLAKLEAAG